MLALGGTWKGKKPWVYFSRQKPEVQSVLCLSAVEEKGCRLREGVMFSPEALSEMELRVARIGTLAGAVSSSYVAITRSTDTVWLAHICLDTC